jgi:hypothetical protein
MLIFFLLLLFVKAHFCSIPVCLVNVLGRTASACEARTGSYFLYYQVNTLFQYLNALIHQLNWPVIRTGSIGMHGFGSRSALCLHFGVPGSESAFLSGSKVLFYFFTWKTGIFLNKIKPRTRIRIYFKPWIRIRMKLMRIRNPVCKALILCKMF